VRGKQGGSQAAHQPSVHPLLVPRAARLHVDGVLLGDGPHHAHVQAVAAAGNLCSRRWPPAGYLVDAPQLQTGSDRSGNVVPVLVRGRLLALATSATTSHADRPACIMAGGNPDCPGSCSSQAPSLPIPGPSPSLPSACPPSAPSSLTHSLTHMHCGVSTGRHKAGGARRCRRCHNGGCGQGRARRHRHRPCRRRAPHGTAGL
jgi:hypothetical protein